MTYTNLNKLLLIRDIQEIAKTYINDDRSYRWIWKNKIADVYHIGYVTFMNYISVPSINAKIDEAIANEHSDMSHESEDVRKRDCRKYKELYGKHFTKDLCEWAVERMENRNGTTHHYNLDEVKSIWHKYKMDDLHNANWYDVMYVMNMAYADFYGRLFTEHHECAMYAYLYISDPDGYEGIAFQRWLGDIKAKDDEVPWQRFI